MESITQKVLDRQIGQAKYLKKSVLQEHCSCFSHQDIAFKVVSHSGTVSTIDMDVTGRYLLAGTRKGCIFFYDTLAKSNLKKLITDEIELETRSRPCSIQTVEFLPCDAGVFTSSSVDGRISIWDTENMKPVDCFKLNKDTYQHQISTNPVNNSWLLAVAAASNNGIILDLQSGNLTHELRGHKGAVLCCTWSPTNEFILATGGLDTMVKLWDVRYAKGALATLSNTHSPPENILDSGSNSPVNGLAFSPDGRFLLSSETNNVIRCMDTLTCANTGVVYPILENKAQYGMVYKPHTFGYHRFNVCLIPSGNKVMIFQIETGKLIKHVDGHYRDVFCCYFQKDKHEVYSGGCNSNILRHAHCYCNGVDLDDSSE